MYSPKLAILVTTSNSFV